MANTLTIEEELELTFDRWLNLMLGEVEND